MSHEVVAERAFTVKEPEDVVPIFYSAVDKAEPCFFFTIFCIYEAGPILIK